MKLERFRGADLPSTLRTVREALGPDAMILNSRTTLSGGLEVMAALPGEVEALRRQLDGPAAPSGRDREPRIRPHVVALVGPAGAGKTTALMKLALHPRGFGHRKVGIITLDTYRVGGLSEIRAYAEVTGIPLEVLYHPEEAEGAVRRLRECEVILVDTPGRLNPEDGGLPDWIPILRALACDEIHLACPAGARTDLVRHYRWRFHPCAPTHFLLTRMDESPRDGGVLEVVRAADLPARWVSEGMEVPGLLAPAFSGILNSVSGAPVAPPVRENPRGPETTESGRAAG